jgi:hypothetical protein
MRLQHIELTESMSRGYAGAGRGAAASRSGDAVRKRPNLSKLCSTVARKR